jgi:hypothetical protein
MSIWNDMAWVPGLRTPFFNSFFETITLMGYPLFLIMFLCFGYFVLGSRRFFNTAMLLIFAGLVNSFLKDIGQDPRPDAAFALDARTGTSYGWPSGHMQIAVVLWGYLAYTMRQNWAYWAAGIFIALQGFSRLYLGVHDLGDVTAGFFIGAALLYGFIALETHARVGPGVAALSAVQGSVLLLAWHAVYVLIYPAHEGHAAPYWFIGIMLGWYVGWRLGTRREVALPGPWPVRVAIGAVMTGACFYAMVFTSRLAKSLGLEDSALAALVNYGMGAVFGVIVVWVLPRLVAGVAARVSGPKASASS